MPVVIKEYLTDLEFMGCVGRVLDDENIEVNLKKNLEDKFKENLKEHVKNNKNQVHRLENILVTEWREVKEQAEEINFPRTIFDLIDSYEDKKSVEVEF